MRLELDLINNHCLKINNFMQAMFKNVGIKLIDFKLEFGIPNWKSNLEFQIPIWNSKSQFGIPNLNSKFD